MTLTNKNKTIQKKQFNELHHRNIHIYDDFSLLTEKYPELKKCIKTYNGNVRINYNNPTALYYISKTLLHYRYNIIWDIPDNFLIPTIPSRANYVHFIADLLTPEHFYNTETFAEIGSNDKRITFKLDKHQRPCPAELIPKGKNVIGLDIGIGANCVLSLLCNKIYFWNMVGTDISNDSLKVSDSIIKNNSLSDHIILLLQENPQNILLGILNRPDIQTLNFSFAICNPPYYDSAEDSKTSIHPNRHRTCRKHEIITHGGESQFILNMYSQSKYFQKRVIWYTSQVSKLKNLKFLRDTLGKEISSNELKSLRCMTLKQGKRDKWVIAWSFFEKEERSSILKFLRNNT
ncbi:YbiN-like RNA methylase [Cryptosporidium canis]|uniref:YbiN-like RNA methylase n=1 Tax=Cryptosporidium canis TaxID=195482 RepID=A0A9D5HYJ3_9CRYT|nr:YbiN-like RNA methylase [Cryptosporidium canis]